MENRGENNRDAAADQAGAEDNNIIDYYSDADEFEESSDDGSQYDDPLTLDDESFVQLQHNDSALTGIEIDYSRVGPVMDRDGFGNRMSCEVGHFIGKNTHLKTLSISEFEGNEEDEQKNTNFCDLLSGAASNSSIKYLYFHSCAFNSKTIASILGSLSPLMQNIRIFAMQLCSVDINSAISLASVLRQSNSLEEFWFIDNRHINPKHTGRILEALEGHHNLRLIRFIGSNMGWEAVHQLGNLVRDPRTSIEHIDLSECLLDDLCITFLAKSLAKKKSLTVLSLEKNQRITNAGWKALFRLFQNDKFVLKGLDVTDNNIDDESAMSLAHTLANNTTLMTLDLSESRLVTEEGWGSLLSVLQNPRSALERLLLSHTSIGSRFSLDLGTALLGNKTLKWLSLKYIHPFGQSGCDALAAYLRHPSCVLEKLELDGSDVDDEGGQAIAKALTFNTTLTTLSLADIEAITIRLARHFSKAICRRSSIADTYASNHTIARIDGTPHSDPKLRVFLRQNRLVPRKLLVRTKILGTHFLGKNGSVIVQKFHDMELNILPHVLAWMGTRIIRITERSSLELSMLHEVLTSMPSLFGFGHQIATTKKRKRGENC